MDAQITNATDEQCLASLKRVAPDIYEAAQDCIDLLDDRTILRILTDCGCSGIHMELTMRAITAMRVNRVLAAVPP